LPDYCACACAFACHYPKYVKWVKSRVVIFLQVYMLTNKKKQLHGKIQEFKFSDLYKTAGYLHSIAEQQPKH